MKNPQQEPEDAGKATGPEAENEAENEVKEGVKSGGKKQRREPDEEQRLRELTEQALELLDQLAAERKKTRELQESHDRRRHRCQVLEAQLEDARRRVRSTRSLRGVGPTSSLAAAPILDLVLWSPTGDLDENWLGRFPGQGGKAQITIICPAGARPSPDLDLGSARLLETETSKPAYVFNLAMNSTDAPLVMFLARGASPTEVLPWPETGLLGDETVALGQPVLETGGGPSLGLHDAGQLLLEYSEIGPGEPAAAVRLDYVAPEAFVVQRQAFLSIGLFDEDLSGAAAVVEYCMRARHLDYQLLGLPTCKVQLQESPGLGRLLDPVGFDRDRLVILARHRPEELPKALASFDAFWEQPPAELEILLRAIYANIPAVAACPESLELCLKQIVSLAKLIMPGKVLTGHLSQVEEALGKLHDLPCAKDSAALAERADRIQELSAHRGGDSEHPVEDLIQNLIQRLDLEREIKGQLHDLVKALGAELDEHRRQSGELVLSLEHAKEVLKGDLQAVREESAAALQAAREELGELRSTLDTTRGRLEEEQAARARAEQQHAQAMATLLRLERTVEDRNRWVVSLLSELSRRRFKFTARTLQEHEIRFLEEHAGSRADADADANAEDA